PAGTYDSGRVTHGHRVGRSAVLFTRVDSRAHVEIAHRVVVEFAEKPGLSFGAAKFRKHRLQSCLKPSRLAGTTTTARKPLSHDLPQHFLYFLPLPQGHGSLRPIFGPRTKGFGGSYSMGPG